LIALELVATLSFVGVENSGRVPLPRTQKSTGRRNFMIQKISVQQHFQQALAHNQTSTSVKFST
jgi:hypothetical protein